MTESRPTPAIVIVGDQHRERMFSELDNRYGRDYELHPCSPTEFVERVWTLKNAGVPIAMVASEYDLNGFTAQHLFHKLQVKLPTARRVVLVPRDRFREALEPLRGSLAVGEIDAYLMLPQGPRDEEFHTAIAEILSEWGWSVSTPEVAMLEIVSDPGGGRAAVLRDFLGRMGMPHRVLPADSDRARALLGEAPDDVTLPVVKVPDVPLLINPSLADLGSLGFGRPTDLPSDRVLDLLIVGAGPAGLAAAVYGASEGLDVVAVDAEAIGGQAGTSSMIRNYLGFPRGISGMRLAQRARGQAMRFGARFFPGCPATALHPGLDGAPHRLETQSGELHARTVLIAAGVKYRRLGVESLEALTGRGVFYGAASTTAREMKGRHAVVVGGGNSAGQAAVHLARFADSVTMVIRRDDLTSSMSEYLIREVSAHPRITLACRTAVTGGGGENALEWLELTDLDTGDARQVETGGLYLLLGAQPHCDWLPQQIVTDVHGFVVSGSDLPEQHWVDGEPPASLATSVPGIFVAGDIRCGSMKRVASATGEGAGVVPLVHAWLARLRSAAVN